MADPVTGVDAAVYTVPTSAPEADGTLAWDATTLVLARVHCGGVTGLGWTYGPGACASLVREKLAGVVTGRDVDDVVGTFDAMVRQTRNATRPGPTAYAISAVDVASWDLKARLLGVPLHRLLGSAGGRVPLYGSGGFTSYDDAATRTQLEGWREQEIPRVKLKIGESWGSRVDRDLARVALAREVVGERCELYVDANGGYERKQAIRVGHALAEHGVTWYEEPVSSDDLDGLAQVRAAVTPDVTAGEYGWDVSYFRRMCAAGAVDCLQVDATRCGGVTEWVRAAAVAASFGLRVSAHCAPHLHAPVAAATPNFRHLEWFHDHVRIESALFDGALDPRGGWVEPREEPGHGLAFRDADAEAYRVG